MQDLDLPRAKVRVRTSGEASSARRVLFAVDPPNTLEMYGPLFARLKKHARLAAFEPPGFGQSRTKRGYGHTLPEQADSVIALLERLGGGAWTLAFPCVSAYVALHVAERRPDLVDGLVLIQAPGWAQERAWVDRVDAKGILRAPIVGQAVNLVRNDSIVRQWYAAAMPDARLAARYAKLALECMDHGARFPLASAFQGVFKDDAAPPSTDKPTLLVWGAADRTHRNSDPLSMHAHAPGASLHVAEACGHFPELEDPARFSDALLAWLASR